MDIETIFNHQNICMQYYVNLMVIKFVYVLLYFTGFVEEMKSVKMSNLKEISLSSLTKPSTYGAASLAAKEVGVCLPFDYKEHVNSLFNMKLE